jgi:serine/threonine-protein kinase
MGVMTPEYASPEQVSGQSVTTATDIYSLGVILFELLSGHRPFEKEYSKRKNILKAIIEDEPQNPSDILIQFQSTYFEKIDTKPNLYSDSDKFADTDDDGIKTKQMSDKDTKELSNNTKLQFLDINPKKLRGDLDNIILKALRKETNRRYQTVEQFTADIWRFLDGLPVTARPSTFGYRASKFFKRNQTGVVAVSLIILAILGGVIATLWQASQTQAEAAKAQKINKFLQNVLNFSNPHWLSSNPKRNREATIADALDESLKNIDKDLADEPEVKAELLLTIGKTYLGQGQYSKAEELIQKSVSLFDGVYGSENTKSMQARVLLGDTLYVQSKFDKSVENYNQAINYLRPRINQDEDTRKYLAIALTDLGNIVSAQGNLDDAEKLNLESLELAQKLKGKDRFIIPIVIANLGTQERRRGNFKKALDYYKQSEAEIISQGNEESDNMGATKRVIGETYRDLKNYEKAEEYFDRSYEVLKKSVGEKNIYTLQTKVRLAQLYFDQGEYEKSKKVVENQLEIQREMFPDGHFLTGLLQITLGKIHTKQGRLKEGEDEIRKSLKYFSENRKEPNPDIAYAKAALGVNLIEQNKKAEGRELLESALQGYAKTSGENHPDTKGVREELERLSK